ncbi:melatonin receptor type 1A-like [Varanus komodoensis]|uniref:melatonin receptor type 1A-like n=1 Tax=Varanus komodoensis TaxID=61221 RepID=UPI001CF7E943|nr:melatonin receptor type 1A-like [Varanus komodoensis]
MPTPLAALPARIPTRAEPRGRRTRLGRAPSPRARCPTLPRDGSRVSSPGMRVNASGPNGSQPQDQLTLDRPPWVASTLAAILIFTIAVDILGNVLVILSVYRNKKLRNADVQ